MKRIEMRFGGGADTPLYCLTDGRAYSYKTDHVELHSRFFGGRKYYASRSGLSGAGWLPGDAPVVPFGYYRTDIGGWEAADAAVGSAVGREVKGWMPISKTAGIQRTCPVVLSDGERIAFVSVPEIPEILRDWDSFWSRAEGVRTEVRQYASPVVPRSRYDVEFTVYQRDKWSWRPHPLRFVDSPIVRRLHRDQAEWTNDLDARWDWPFSAEMASRVRLVYTHGHYYQECPYTGFLELPGWDWNPLTSVWGNEAQAPPLEGLTLNGWNVDSGMLWRFDRRSLRVLAFKEREEGLSPASFWRTVEESASPYCPEFGGLGMGTRPWLERWHARLDAALSERAANDDRQPRDDRGAQRPRPKPESTDTRK